jgi:hypothetical protein
VPAARPVATLRAKILSVAAQRDRVAIAATPQAALDALLDLHIGFALVLRLRPGAPGARARAAVHATFGLLNSTQRSASELTRAAMADLLHAMAARAVGAS